VRGPFDLIIANPPYVPRAHESTLASDVRNHEPAIALFGRGEDGLDDVRQVLAESASRLAPSGRLMMEFGFGQGPTVRRDAQQAGLEIIDILRDLQGHDRTLVAALPASRAAL
jgi:release factor glutamine methyltransferase